MFRQSMYCCRERLGKVRLRADSSLSSAFQNEPVSSHDVDVPALGSIDSFEGLALNTGVEDRTARAIVTEEHSWTGERVDVLGRGAPQVAQRGLRVGRNGHQR